MAGPGSGRDPLHHRASGVSAGADLVREVGSGSLAPGGRRRRSPRPGVTLFVVAFFASPLILIWWAGGHVSLKITGWPRWRLFAASLAGEAFIVWIRGGPVPALAAQFSGLLRLAEQFGAPVVYLPAQGSFLIPQIALSVPVGLLAASLTRRTDPAVPDPATATRAVRRERDRRQARRLVERVRSSETNSQTNNALGVSLGGDLTAWRAGRYVVLPDHAARLPRLVLGRPGQGKSDYLAGGLPGRVRGPPERHSRRQGRQ